MRYFVLIPALLAISACGPKPVTVEELHLHDVKLPGGQVIQVEIMFDLMDMLRGMMFRSYLAPDRGMLFMHRAPGRYSYFMYQHLISLDMIWMDPSHRIVEIVHDAPPCKTEASKCPHYGGNAEAQYVLELAGGMAKKYDLKIGDYITF